MFNYEKSHFAKYSLESFILSNRSYHVTHIERNELCDQDIIFGIDNMSIVKADCDEIWMSPFGYPKKYVSHLKIWKVNSLGLVLQDERRTRLVAYIIAVIIFNAVTRFVILEVL